ncbi:MAG: recombinase family protein [Candidatus Tectomicrobia bacterium]|nr:recombinase family protein [Candidatus Tectomicrobia bacterium]
MDSRHLERLAVVYVRQSTPQQVLNHQESTQLQYGLVHRAVALGWSEARVLVIDDDLGQSGATAEGRQGFQRLVAEVGLDHVGLVLGVDMSRLARSSKDWHQLLEMCALFSTLIADLDGIYDPSQYNDRLLLGLKGTMSEAELHILKQRMHQGKLHKARRGELRFSLPIGYGRDATGEIRFDPDEQAQHVVDLIFRKFDEIGTLHGLLRYLVKQGIELGVRNRQGPAKGSLEWRRPNRMTLQNVLKNPIYAGAYAYGRRQVDTRKKQSGRPSTGRVTRLRRDYHVLIPDHHPAYITWDQYERNLSRLESNRAHADSLGAVRDGASLLAGLVRCGRCGHRMQVHYSGPTNAHSYVCNRLATDYGDEFCGSLQGHSLDTFVSQWVLKALEPATLTLSLEATNRLEQERQEMDQLWQLRLERSEYEVERAARHYRLIEPENRLVARQLATEWEERLTAHRQLQEDHQRFLHTQPQVLLPAEREAIEQLAHDIPALWQAETTTMADRKEIVRQIIQRVMVNPEGKSERVQVTIEWFGGDTTSGLVIRPINRLENLSRYTELCDRIATLSDQGYRTSEMIHLLTQEGFRSPRHAKPFTPQTVRQLKQRLGLRPSRPRPRPPLDQHEWWFSELAQILRISVSTLHLWRKRGKLQVRWHEQSRKWVALADSAELNRLEQRCKRSVGEANRQRWLDAQPFPLGASLSIPNT